MAIPWMYSNPASCLPPCPYHNKHNDEPIPQCCEAAVVIRQGWSYGIDCNVPRFSGVVDVRWIKTMNS
ncbi:hypothetical protein TNIN_30351 [Trichonephila inaurata madagascariensis]|uniref:Uncharacterized protein n=1 Tax=Trichonephila inaurata madagascariensis TaxID=2747483 RepID=A0A8X7CFL2_9ARAC|nr:hypothetical protein TNIN_30351 [Trichonephila inaurata madagascariensis]